ncbi:MAG: hypothetical protein GKR89_29250 [Candidatus Latescibacteria bacterium]|nr:hypothetical protein [Candidatus Latescibacterota bacterium]
MSAANDTGYLFLGPRLEKKRKTLKNGHSITAYHRSGVVAQAGAESPWRHATFFCQGTSVEDADGQLVQGVDLCEAIDADGDISWGVLWRPAGGPETFQFVLGTGKWTGIRGGGNLLPPVQQRADDYQMPGYEINWQLDGKNSKLSDHIDPDGDYPESDRCISFHGPHVIDSTKALASGYILEVNSQSGVLYSETPEAVSPRNYATCFDRGSTIKDADGKTLGDVMLLEDTDADGDVAWLYHLWWYGQGGGIYKFVGGTGKWKGIVGDGQTGSMVAQRNDDHYMLRSEIRWRIE